MFQPMRNPDKTFCLCEMILDKKLFSTSRKRNVKNRHPFLRTRDTIRFSAFIQLRKLRTAESFNCRFWHIESFLAKSSEMLRKILKVPVKICRTINAEKRYQGCQKDTKWYLFCLFGNFSIQLKTQSTCGFVSVFR